MYIRFFVVFFLLCVPVCCAADASGRASVEFPKYFVNKIGKLASCPPGGIITEIFNSKEFKEQSAFKELACDVADCTPRGIRLLREKFAHKLLGTRAADVGKVMSSIVLFNMCDLAAFYGNVGALHVACEQGIPVVWPWQDGREQHALHIKIAAQRGHWKYIQEVFTPEQRAAAGSYVHRSLDGRDHISLVELLKHECIDALCDRSGEDVVTQRDRHNALLTGAMLLSSRDVQDRFARASLPLKMADFYSVFE